MMGKDKPPRLFAIMMRLRGDLPLRLCLWNCAYRWYALEIDLPRCCCCSRLSVCCGTA